MVDVERQLGTAIIEPIDVEVCWPSLISSVSRLPDPAVLESSLATTPFSRYSIVAANPVTSVQLRAYVRQPFQWLRASLGPTIGGISQGTTLPFVGGWIGFLSYEFGAFAEPRLLRGRLESDLPAARLSLYDTAAVFDHLNSRWYAVAIDWTDGDFVERPSARERLQGIRTLLQNASRPADREEPRLPSPAESSCTREEFLRRVQRIQEYIRAGDAYQVNLAERFEVATDAPADVVYQRLRACSPSGHAAFLGFDETAILSSSPELFLHCADGVATTRPIKGTRPRTGHPALDRAQRRELERSAKDRAELTMIVDLLRNDLGRVCDFGSVRVLDEGSIEEHPVVFHRVATIDGRLRRECDWCDLLSATFPCGSITGAPKLRAMQIIEELEPVPRGVYCGAIGYVGLDGAMQFNVAIRTIVARRGLVRFYAGSGIVADSIPEREYDETLAKARGMLLALNSRLPDSPSSRLAEAAIA